MTDNIRSNEEKKLEQENNKYQADHDVIYEEYHQKTASSMADGNCAVCKRKGITLFLTRKSILPKGFRNIAWSKGMAKLDGEPAIDLTTHEYAYRMLREGFVYILLETNDKKRCYLGYEVTAQGLYRHKAIEEMATLHPKEAPKACLSSADKHYLRGYFITIDSVNDMYTKAWIAYSHRSWSKKVRDYYIDLDEAQLTTRFVAIDLHNVLGDKNHSRLFPLSDFESQSKYLVELECRQQDIGFYYKDIQDDESGKKLNSSVFYSSSYFNSIKDNKAAFFKNSLSLKPAIYNQEAAVLVLDDLFGVAEELAISKRQNIIPLVNRLQNIDKSIYEAMRDDYNQKLLSVSDKEMSPTDIVSSQKEIEKESNPIIYDAKNTENKLDLKINEQLFKLEPIPRNVLGDMMNKVLTMSSPTLTMVDGGLYLSDYLRAATREEQIVNYYSEQLEKGNTEKLDYFSPDLSYRRQVKHCINIFHSLLKNKNANNKEDVRYIFYNHAGDVLGIKGANHNVFAYSLEQSVTMDSGNMNEIASPRYKFMINYPGIDISYMRYISYMDSDAVKRAVKPESYGSCQQIKFNKDEESKVKAAYQKSLNNILINDVGYSYSGPETDKINYLRKTTGKQHLTRKDLEIAKVEKYIYPETELINSEKDFDEEWKKYKDRLSEKKIIKFDEIDKVAFETIKKKIIAYSEDHKNYIKWLFTLAKPTEKAEINENTFWLIEVEANSSDAHLGCMSDIVNMLDGGYLGDIKLDSEFEIWNNLINDNHNLFVHALMGKEGGLWQAIIESKQAGYENQQLLSIAQIMTQIAEKTDKFMGIEIQMGHESEAISMTQRLIQRFTITAAAGMAHFPNGSTVSNALIAKSFFMDASLVTSDIYLHSFGARVAYNQLPHIMKELETRLPQLKGINSYRFPDLNVQGGSYEVIRNIQG
ncbi:hypothetical protein JMI89_11460, partial [Frischella sp. Ac48]|uniref:toxin VasX n=1 Tax=Frischella sp. Ac48 TaxID=2804531 RepID=UPI001C7DF5FA